MLDRVTTIDGWRFKRVSAAYIDVFPPGSTVAVDCINVYDYAKGEPRIPIDCPPSKHRQQARLWMADHAGELEDYAQIARMH